MFTLTRCPRPIFSFRTENSDLYLGSSGDRALLYYTHLNMLTLPLYSSLKQMYEVSTVMQRVEVRSGRKSYHKACSDAWVAQGIKDEGRGTSYPIKYSAMELLMCL